MIFHSYVSSPVGMIFVGSVLEDLHEHHVTKDDRKGTHLSSGSVAYIYIFAHSDHNTHLQKKTIERNLRSIASAELFVFGLV